MLQSTGSQWVRYNLVTEQQYILVNLYLHKHMGFPGGSVVKNLPANAGDMGSIPESGRSLWEGNASFFTLEESEATHWSNPLQYSCLGNPMGRVAWWAIVHGIAKQSDRTQQLNHNNVYMHIHHIYFLYACYIYFFNRNNNNHYNNSFTECLLLLYTYVVVLHIIFNYNKIMKILLLLSFHKWENSDSGK